MATLLLVHRELDHKTTSLRPIGRKRNSAAMFFDETFGKVEPEPKPFRQFLSIPYPVSFFKNQGLFFRCNTRSVIFNFNVNSLTMITCADPDIGVIPGIYDCIVD